MLCVAILLMPQVVYGFNYENPKMAERVQWLNGDRFEEDMEELRKPRWIEIDVVVTAYAVGDGHTPGSIMASGKIVYVGAVAMNGVPLGTKVVIDDVEYTVEDRMMYDGYVDIFMDSVEAADNWGVQRKTVRVMQ